MAMRGMPAPSHKNPYLRDFNCQTVIRPHAQSTRRRALHARPDKPAYFLASSFLASHFLAGTFAPVQVPMTIASHLFVEKGLPL